MNKRSNLIWANVAGIAYFVTAVVVSLVQFKLVVDYLSRPVAGLWLVVMTLASYILLFDFGFGPTLTREMSLSLGRAGADNAAESSSMSRLLATQARLINTACLIALFVCIPAGAAYLVSLLDTAAHANRVLVAWTLFGVGTVFNLRALNFLAGLEGFGHVSLSKVIRTICALTGLVLSALLLQFDLDVLSFGLGMFFQGGLALLLSRHRMRRLSAMYPNGDINTGVALKLLGPSLRWAVMSLGALLIFQTSNLVIASKLSVSLVPIYDAVSKMGFAFVGFAIIPASIAVPTLGRLYSGERREDFNRLLLANNKFALLTMVVLCSVFLAFYESIITIWVGSSIVPDRFLVITLMLVFLLEANHVSLALGVMAAGHIVFASMAVLAGILNVALALILSERLGLIGVALATLLSQLLTNNWYVPVYALRTFGISAKQYASATLKQVVVVFVPLFILAYSLAILLEPLPVVVRASAAAALVALSLTSLVVFYFREQRAFSFPSPAV